MTVRKILVTIEAEDDLDKSDLDEYMAEIESACAKVEGRAMISGACKVTIEEAKG